MEFLHTLIKWLIIIIAVLVMSVTLIFLVRRIIKYRAKMGNLIKRLRNKAVGVVFGLTPWRFAVCSPEDDDGHVACFGGTGSGKTSAILVNSLRAWCGTTFAIDVSGDISENVPDSNKIIYAPENADTTPYSVFAAVDSAAGIAEQDERLQALSFALIPNVPTDSDVTAFYKTSARTLLQAALVAYYHAGLDFIPICKTIVGLSFESLLEDINASKNDLARRLVAGFEGVNEKIMAATKQELDTALMLFATNPKIERSVRRGGISPEDLEKNSICIKIDDIKMEIYSSLLRLVTSQILTHLAGRPNGAQPPILCCLDEFASLGKLDILPALRKLRKKNVRIMILTQSLADLELIYGHDETRAMMDNFAYKVILNASEPETQEYFSKLAGERTAIRKTITTNADGSVSESWSEHRVKIANPEVFGKLDKTLILLYSGRVMQLKKNYYFNKWIW